MHEYSAAQVATLQSRLEKQLGPEYISSRIGPSGQKVYYLAAEKCIMLANEVFGFNGWSSSIRDIQVDFVDENTTTGKISLGLSVIVRVTLRDGSYHEDIGYGHIENCKGKATAFEKAKKEGTTDALKRTLRNFGNILGNCIYDKEYLKRISKVKVPATKWDPENLHRHADFVPAPKKQPTSEPDAPVLAIGEDQEDEFGDFDEADFSIAENVHPDEVVLEALHSRANSPNKQVPPANPATNLSAPTKPSAMANPTMGTPHLGAARSLNGSATDRSNGPITHSAVGHAPVQAQSEIGAPAAPGVLSSIAKDLGDYKHDPTVGFLHPKAANHVKENDGAALAAAPFNPRLETSSLRRTTGIDHSTSKPMTRPRTGPSLPAAANTPGRSHFVNPHLDPNRRIGMPNAVPSPLQNRHTYKAPSMKRPADGAFDGSARPVLNDVTAATANIPSEAALDGKRVKMDAPISDPVANTASR